LIERVGVPLAAPSANRFGRTSPTTAEHVRHEFPDKSVLILDGGPCDVGLESTVLHIQQDGDLYRLSILRAGGISQEELERTLKNQKFFIQFHSSLSKKESPGHMKHHYMPEVPLVLVRNPYESEKEIIAQTRNQISKLPDEIEGIQIRKPENLERIKELILPLEAPLAFRLLYAEMRRLGESGQYDLLYFRLQDFHRQPQWEALMDRLNKAASLIVD
jgi:L-threonylcarbamoyladenylate synthase